MMRSFVRAVAAAALAWLVLAASMGPAHAFDQPRAGEEARPSFGEPGISPDGSEIAFVSGGDIWTVPAGGGEARLLMSHPATEARPLYSPSGDQLAFVSTRTGNGDIYVLTFKTGAVRRLTFDDAPDALDGWSRDGRWIYFSSSSHDIAGMNDIYRVSFDGGTPMPVSADRYVNEYFAAPAPDGARVAFTARGIPSSQWWRKGHSHIDESEIWILDDGAAKSYTRVTEVGAKQMWPMWAADGRTLFYVSDRSGAQNIWRQEPGKPAAQVTTFTDGRVLWPSISTDGRRVAFERDFGIWVLDTSTGRASEVAISRRGASVGPAVEHLTLSNQFQELALSPDGKKVAIVARGEVFAASAKEGGDATRVTSTPANESGIAWAPDARRLVYVSDRDGASHLFMFDFRSMSETALTHDALEDALPTFSPDGRLLAFERGQHELRVLDLEAKTERVVASGYLSDRLGAGHEIAWSPDAKWIAYLATGAKGFTSVWVVPSAGGDPRQVSWLANASIGGVSWSPDGTFLLFDTSQRTESAQVARIDLTPRAPKFREDQFRDLFKEETSKPLVQPSEAPAALAAPEAPKPAAPPDAQDGKKTPRPVKIAWDLIRRRLSLMPVGLDVSAVTISPDGKWALLMASVAGQANLYTYSLDELSRERPVARQLTSTPGAKSAAQFSPDSKEVFFLEDGRIQAITLDRRESRPLAVTAEMDIDFAKERLEVFDQAWTYQRDSFFDPHFNGVDWNAVRAAYRPHAAGAATPDELRRIILLMVGELNASHLGISAPPTGGATAATGRLGISFDRGEFERDGRFRVASLVPLGPSAATGSITPGDYLLAMDGVALTGRTNLDERLERRVGRRVVLTMSSSADGREKRDVAVSPVNQGVEKGLLYREWVEANRAYVEKASGGRLGYVHMIDMGAPSLAQLYVDLDIENQTRDGVVVDVRNNNGGFVNVYAIDVLSRRPYLTMTPRGLPPTPARAALGQRALEAPTILVTNQHSLSDAEDFTEGYRALKLGKVVGEPTAGWIIYTWSIRLIDGSSLRLPRTRITTSDGSPMELHPRPVDVAVTRPVGEGLRGKDSQLDTAVAELLKGLPAKR
jgi:Tol biopolymer transport system component